MTDTPPTADSGGDAAAGAPVPEGRTPASPADPAPGGGQGPEPPPSASARNAWWVGLGIVLSRISGLVRDVVVAVFLGSDRRAEVFMAGLRTPNLLQNLLGEGTLSASFIPGYARFLEEGREEDAGRFAGAVLGLLATTAFAVALVGVLLAPVIPRILFFQWEPSAQVLLTRVLRYFFPMTAVLVCSAWALGILNVHRRFFVSYVAPVVWNLSFVAAAVTAVGFTLDAPTGPAADRLVVAMAWGGLVGGVLQLLVQLPFFTDALKEVRLSLGRGVTGVREAVRSFVPVVLARGAVNLSAYVDMFLAGLLVEGALAHLTRAQTLYLLPISLFGMAVAAAELPELSRAHPGAREAVAERVRAALARVRFLLIPSAVAYLAFGDVLVAGLYQWGGAFGTPDGQVVGWVLAAYALGLPASAASRTLSSAFYALRDTRTPARIAGLRIVLSLAVAALLIFPLDRIRIGPFGVGAAGLALGAAVAAWTEYGLLRRNLGRRIGPHGPPVGELVRLLGSAVVGAGAALAFAGRLWPALEPAVTGLARTVGIQGPGPANLGRAAGTALLYGVVYLTLAGGWRRLPSRRKPVD